MTKKKAAKILLDQTEKTIEPGFDFDSWKIQSSSLIETFFGKNSDEYKSLHKQTAKFYTGYETESERTQAITKEIQSICAILNSCSYTIEIKGINKKSKENIVSHFNNYALLVISITLIGFGFYSHQFLLDIISKNNKADTSIQINHPLSLDSNKINQVFTDSTMKH